MTGKGSDIVGSTFIPPTGHLLLRQFHWMEKNARINFHPEGFWSKRIMVWQHWGGVHPQAWPSQQNYPWSQGHTEHPLSDVWGIPAFHLSSKKHWLLPRLSHSLSLAPSDRDMLSITVSKQCSPCVWNGGKAALCPWNRERHHFQFLFQLVQQKASMCPLVFHKPQGAASQHAELVKLMAD